MAMLIQDGQMKLKQKYYITIDLKQSYEISKNKYKAGKLQAQLTTKIEVSNDGVLFKSVTAVSLK